MPVDYHEFLNYFIVNAYFRQFNINIQIKPIFIAIIDHENKV